MAYPFPSEEWLMALKDVLNSDSQYADIAENWEGDIVIVIEPNPKEQDQNLPEPRLQVGVLRPQQEPNPPLV